MNIDDRPTTDQLTLHFDKFQTLHPITIMFGSRAGFWGHWNFRFDQIQDGDGAWWPF